MSNIPTLEYDRRRAHKPKWRWVESMMALCSLLVALFMVALVGLVIFFYLQPRTGLHMEALGRFIGMLYTIGLLAIASVTVGPIGLAVGSIASTRLEGQPGHPIIRGVAQVSVTLTITIMTCALVMVLVVSTIGVKL